MTAAAPVVNSTGWQTVALTEPVRVLAGEKIWLAWVYEKNPGIAYVEGTPERAHSAQLWTGGMPETFGSSSRADYAYSIYATYSATSTGFTGLTVTRLLQG